MSSDEHRFSTDSAPTRPSPAAGVSFGNVGPSERNAEGSSQHGSRGSGELWREKRESWKERLLTPDRPERRSEDGSNRGSEHGSRKRFKRSGGGGGFLREGVFGHGSPKSREGSERSQGKNRVVDGSLQASKRRFDGGRPSGDSHGSSPLSREVSRSRPQQMNGQEQRPPSRQTSMDPAQLVQMALSLSESRKRQVSNTQPLPLAAPRNRHVSGPSERLNTARRGSGRQRASMPAFDDSRRASSQYDERPSKEPMDDPADNIVYTFTPATLARAEKARKYFELANEHRRLLQYLPPLKPDADSSGNYTFESRSSPGFAQPDIRRVRSDTVRKHELGRPYNPLQILRNRRLRHRERRPFPVPPEQFQDTPGVVEWLDAVEQAAGRPDYRSAHDVVQLPSFGKEQTNEVSPASGRPKGHQRTGTASTVIARPDNDWSVDPAERLADTYWIEQGDNKVLIENRRNQRLFPERNTESRKSADINRSTSQVDGPQEEEVPEEDLPKKHHHRLPIPRHLTGHKKLSHIGRTASMSSASSSEERKPNPLYLGPDHENVGPLQRHMDKMIAKDQNGQLTSPEVVSPDYWDSEHTPFPTRKARPDNVKRGSVSMEHANEYLSGGSGLSHQRSKSADGRVSKLVEGERIRSSFDSTPPMSPIAERFVPSSMGIDLSPPSSAKHQKHKSRILPIFRSRSKERNTTIEGRDFATPPDHDHSRDNNSPTIDPTRLSVDSSRPAIIKRHRTTESVTSNLGRTNTQVTSDGSIKEPGSAVGRFFRGRRIGNLMRNESSRLSGKGRGRYGEASMSDGSALPSDGSDTEGSVDGHAGKMSMDGSEASPRTSFDSSRGKHRSYIPNLPTFTSTAAKEKPAMLTPVISQEESDPVSRQAAAQRESNKSPRIQRLLPPRINLPDNDDGVGNDLPSQKSDSYLTHNRRKSYGFLQANGQQDSARSSRVSLGEPGRVGYRDNMPVSDLPKIDPAEKKRHWSISDRRPQPPPKQPQRVSERDVARARALLLASGIKARSLVSRANTPAAPPPKYLREACDLVSREAPTVPLRESHVTAAQILTSDLDKTLHDLGEGPKRYHSSIGPRLHTRLGDLKALANDKLTATVHNSSDEADAFTIRLTSEQTLRVKQVDDAVDEMLRLRRRQFRILRRAGFKVLEWMVLGLMWGIWFVVLCYNTVRKLIVGLLKLLRWLLWW